jgi:hypothetical protein
MNRNQIENLYKVNGLTDFRLRNTEDLLRVHGIDYKAVDGYSQLDDLNRQIYEGFIINIFNVFGLESRGTLVPKGIYFVEDIQYLVKEKPEDDFYIVAGGIVKAIDRNGLKSVLHTWEDEDYKHLKIDKREAGKNYLRFEYEHKGRSEWLHVVKDGKVWY